MKTVAELIERIESKYPVGHPTNCSRSVTGEPYVVIGSQSPDEPLPSILGTVDEGRRRELAFDEETAVLQTLACFQAYCEDRGGTLYYRFRPELEWTDDKKYCQVYFRCLISDATPKNIPCDRCSCGLAAQTTG